MKKCQVKIRSAERGDLFAYITDDSDKSFEIVVISEEKIEKTVVTVGETINRNYITADDVPESVKREVQAEALLEAAQMLQCHKPHHKLSKIEMLCVYAEQLREQNK